MSNSKIQTYESAYIYMARFDNIDSVKVGWSTNPERRCNELHGKPKQLHTVRFTNCTKSKIMTIEGMFHKALKEYSVERFSRDYMNDGSTEYFEIDAVSKFEEVCKILNLKFEKFPYFI